MDEKSVIIIGSETKAERRFARNAALLLIDQEARAMNAQPQTGRMEKNDN
jgi:hypothetical protein